MSMQPHVREETYFEAAIVAAAKDAQDAIDMSEDEDARIEAAFGDLFADDDYEIGEVLA